MSDNLRDQFNVETPLMCPVCGGDLVETGIRTLGSITGGLRWEMHIGRCEEHGWFQAEIVGAPPRDIFAVHKPFGKSRRMVIDDTEYYQFATAWKNVELDQILDRTREPVDPLDPQYWKPLNLK